MGSPLGPTLANAFLVHFEKNWLRNFPSDFKPQTVEGMELGLCLGN